jgi:hypothetical protein
MDELHEPPKSFEREWPEFLDEVRVALPGVQLLFGFLLAAPFTQRFEIMPHHVQSVYLGCFLATTVACAFLIAPSVYHRLHWRRDVRDKEQMLLTCNRLAIGGGLFLAVAMIAAVYVVTSLITSPMGVRLSTLLSALLIVSLWFGLPLRRRSRERTRPGAPS